jgi:parvulin-like peptidyl-prolyl isomerase
MSSKDAVRQGVRTLRWKRRVAAAMAGVVVLAVCLTVRWIKGSKPAAAANPAPAPTAAQPQKPQVVATVNLEAIGRQELAQECLDHYGKDVLETMINKYLIFQYCQQLHVTVTKQEVNDEIERMARKFNVSADQWVKMLQQERNITPEQYAADIVWPTLALRKVASNRIQPTPDEIKQAFESQYGEAVKVRMIVVEDPKLAGEVLERARAQPNEFAVLARKYSVDSNSASAGGLIQPIHHFVGERSIEDAAFALQAGQISPVVQVGNQCVILKCEERLPPVEVNIAKVQDRLAEAVREKKLHAAGADIFHQLQQRAVIQNAFADPRLSQRMPGLAAIVNDRKITVGELAEECIERHGKEALDGTINRHLLEQSLHTKHLEVTQHDLDVEIARAAIAIGKVKKNGQADVDGWLTMVTKEQGISQQLYIRDAVWPTVALKKITGDVTVSDDDLQKGFEANYGKRVRCRAIVVTSQRKAQEVWQLARRELDKPNPNPAFFGQLAEQYSVDPSKTLQGRVPPIQRYGGTPMLEREAFSLKAGDLSSIIQIGEEYVILYCEGYTDPQKVQMSEVHEMLGDDIHEKKMRLAMAAEFNRMKDGAQIDNNLTGEVHSPRSAARAIAGGSQRNGGSHAQFVTPAGIDLPAGGPPRNP